jgi:TonB family protein
MVTSRQHKAFRSSILRFCCIGLCMSLSLYAQTDNNGSSSPAAIPQDQVIVEVAKAVPAEYPPEAVEHNVHGTVSVSVVISEDGDVERALPEGGDPALQTSAVAAANQYKFKSRKGDTYVRLKCWAILSFDFQLQHSEPSSVASAPAPVAGQLSHGEQFPNKIRVSWTTMSRQAVKFADPIFAIGAKAAGAKGAVVLDETIGPDGKVTDVRAVSGPEKVVNPMIGALRLWEFEPYLFLGEPIAVDTQIRVNFVGEKKARGPSDEAQQWMLHGPQYIVQEIPASQTSPQYPEAAKQKGVRSKVVVAASIGEDGVVREVRVVSGDPLLIDAAKALVTKTQANVHMRNGKPEEVYVLVTVNFGL